jgi:hypothetical protein
MTSPDDARAGHAFFAEVAMARLSALLMVLLVPTLLRGNGGCDAPASPASFDVLLRNGTLLQGRNLRLDADNLYLDNGPSKVIPRADVLEVCQTGVRWRESSTPFVLLANGDRLPGHVTAMDHRTVKVRLAAVDAGQEWTLPLNILRGAWRQMPGGTTDPERFRWSWRHESPKLDQLRLTNGDVLEGAVVQIRQGVWNVQASSGSFELPTERIACFRRSDALAAPSANAVQVIVILSDDTRLSLAEAVVREGNLIARTVHDAKCVIPWREVCRIEFAPSKADALSTLKPLAEKQVPYFDQSLSMVRDGDVYRKSLRWQTMPADHGLGMMSHHEVDYALEANYHAFLADVTLAEPLLNRSPEVSVLVDGQVRFRARLSKDNLSARTWLDLAGAKRLTLRVDHGPDSNGPSAVNWLSPRLLK